MTLQSSGNSISLSDIQTEFGGSGSISLSEYYRDNAYAELPGGMLSTANNQNIPKNLATPPAISLSNFYDAEKYIKIEWELIGGGGGGAGSVGGTGSNGGNSQFHSSSSSTVGSPGTEELWGQYAATGGINSISYGSNGSGGAPNLYSVAQPGEDSYYGSGGTGGLNSGSGADTDGNPPAATAYGAGGGSAGTQFASNTGGEGGDASTRRTSSGSGFAETPWWYKPGENLYIIIGSGGAGGVGSRRSGGRGGHGYVKLTIDGTETEFTTPGTHTFTVPSA
jgi:hypothetical protein